MPRPYLLLKLPRTGSTYLGRVLDTHPQVVCKTEYLNRVKDQPRDQKLRVLRAFYDHGPTGKGVPAGVALGQSMNPFKYDLDASDIVSAFGQGWAGGLAKLGRIGRKLAARTSGFPLAVVVLTRQNALKQVISHASVRQRGSYASDRGKVADDSALHGQEYDVEELARQATAAKQRSERLLGVARTLSSEALELTYETLQADPKATLDGIFRFLDVPAAPAGFDYTAGYTKVLSDDLREVVSNYDELAANPVLAAYL